MNLNLKKLTLPIPIVTFLPLLPFAGSLWLHTVFATSPYSFGSETLWIWIYNIEIPASYFGSPNTLAWILLALSLYLGAACSLAMFTEFFPLAFLGILILAVALLVSVPVMFISFMKIFMEGYIRHNLMLTVLPALTLGAALLPAVL